MALASTANPAYADAFPTLIPTICWDLPAHSHLGQFGLSGDVFFVLMLTATCRECQQGLRDCVSSLRGERGADGRGGSDCLSGASCAGPDGPLYSNTGSSGDLLVRETNSAARQLGRSRAML